MAVFKCKMCGGQLEIKEGMSICECQYCGTMQTLPNLDDEKRIQLYDRANYFRRENEFDKAMGIYEMIIADEKEDAEAYWGIVLCKYGIEYVEDPKTHKRVPTVNRAQYTSVFIDEDYQSALKYADRYQRDIYEAEAKAIDEIQKGILEISNNEDPFDVFICYKETDNSGRRTQDSVFAQDIYKALTGEGYKVFFSRVTLEDKLGTEYEPYIFAALHSAPVMIVVGTSSENLNSVWVKNEWSRYLALVKAGEEKTLIPVYKDMDPYDLPEEFSYLQAQDMNKVGFMQDLIRGVKKIVSQDVVDERQKKGTSAVIVDTMMNRGSKALADSDWETAKRCYDTILDYDDKNIDALIGKLKAVKQVQDLNNSKTPFINDVSFKKILQFADEETKEKLLETNKTIVKKRSSKKKKSIAIIAVLSVAIVVCGFMLAPTIKDFFLEKQFEKQLQTVQTGDIILFGAYEQDNNLENGKEAIEWIVLDKQDNKILLISKYAMDSVKYNEKEESVEWKTCSLNIWLNNTFINEAFDQKQQSMINKENGLFLLDTVEAQREYFNSDEDRQCQPTAYCIERGGYLAINNNCNWWLRSNDKLSNQTEYVSAVGTIAKKGRRVNDDGFVVRPAMWIDLSE